jgi:hypothetical protein
VVAHKVGKMKERGWEDEGHLKALSSGTWEAWHI